MITCQITDIVQGFDLSKKVQRTFAVLVLPGGKEVRVPVSEDDAAAIIALALSDGTPVDYQQPPSKSEAFTHGASSDGTSALIFGAQEVARDVALVDDVERRVGGLPSIEEELRSEGIPVEPRAPGSGPPLIKLRARLVGADDKGNPIMEYPNGVDHTQVVGGPSANADEDGVQQL